MISGEAIQRINIAINELPPKCRLVFKLVKEDGLKYREVAELLQISLKTVENQIGIALKKIHSTINVHLPQPSTRSPR
jgi:RNA polymerase sigma factor (sigma-70 family)